MQASHKNIILSTVPVLRENGLLLTEHFYNRMFFHNPELKNIFNMANQVNGGKQKVALAMALLEYASNIDKLENLSGLVKMVSSKHTSLNIRPEHYFIVGKHLIGSIKEVLGEAATPEILEAWENAYNQLANVLINAETEIYKKQIQEDENWTGWRPFTIKSKVVESEEVTSFYLFPNDGGKLGSFKPGQYISIQIFIKELNLYQSRQYSISSKPNQEYYRISVKREGNQTAKGLISHKLHNELQEGDVVSVSAPNGSLTLPSLENPVVFISGGIGITPFISTLEFLHDSNPSIELHWIHGARSKEHHSFKTLVEDIHKKMPNMKKAIFYNNAEEATEEIFPGNVDLKVLKNLEIKNNTSFFICGPEPFIAKQAQDLIALGVQKTNIYFEEFGPSAIKI